MIALTVDEAEQAFLKDRIFAVPQGERKAEPLLVVGDARKSVFSPAIRAGAGLIVSEIIPGVAPFAVVLAHGSPLPFAEIRAPLLPGDFLLAGLVESFVFSSHRAPDFLRKHSVN